jgi:hypothetical protein
MLKVFPLHTSHVPQYFGLLRRGQGREGMDHDQFDVKVLCEQSSIPARATNTRGKISGKYN